MSQDVLNNNLLLQLLVALMQQQQQQQQQHQQQQTQHQQHQQQHRQQQHQQQFQQYQQHLTMLDHHLTRPALLESPINNHQHYQNHHQHQHNHPAHQHHHHQHLQQQLHFHQSPSSGLTTLDMNATANAAAAVVAAAAATSNVSNASPIIINPATAATAAAAAAIIAPNSTLPLGTAQQLTNHHHNIDHHQLQLQLHQLHQQQTSSPSSVGTPETTLANNNIDTSTSTTPTGLNNHNNNGNGNTTTLTSCPSSSLLAKLNAVTTRPDAHLIARELDAKMIDLLEAFYAINDNPEPAAIEMIARRINVSIDRVSDWFDKKRLKLNPFAGPRSPPAKKREGGRVVTFSEYQRSLLEAIFDENNYLHPQEYEELSNLIQVPSRNIKIWFKNRRSKQRLSGRIVNTNQGQ